MTATRIANALKGEILSGHLRPGEELSQAAIAERFSVSRIPVRDALSMLANWGLADMAPRRSAQVRVLSEDEVNESFDLRVILEGDILRKAISRATAENWDEIDRVRRLTDIDAEGPKWLSADLDFHMALYKPASRRWELSLIENLHLICQAQIASYLGLKAAPKDWLNDHEKICSLSRKGSGDAAVNLLTAHINRARESLLRGMH